MALASATQKAVWLWQLSDDMNIEMSGPTVIFEDNQSTICMAHNPQFHGCTKHIGIKYHYMREQINNNMIELRYCWTNDMIADIFTKGLSQEKFMKLRDVWYAYTNN